MALASFICYFFEYRYTRPFENAFQMTLNVIFPHFEIFPLLFCYSHFEI